MVFKILTTTSLSRWTKWHNTNQDLKEDCHSRKFPFTYLALTIHMINIGVLKKRYQKSWEGNVSLKQKDVQCNLLHHGEQLFHNHRPVEVSLLYHGWKQWAWLHAVFPNLIFKFRFSHNLSSSGAFRVLEWVCSDVHSCASLETSKSRLLLYPYSKLT